MHFELPRGRSRDQILGHAVLGLFVNLGQKIAVCRDSRTDTYGLDAFAHVPRPHTGLSPGFRDTDATRGQLNTNDLDQGTHGCWATGRRMLLQHATVRCSCNPVVLPAPTTISIQCWIWPPEYITDYLDSGPNSIPLRSSLSIAAVQTMSTQLSLSGGAIH